MDFVLVVQNTDFLHFLTMTTKSTLREVSRDLCYLVDGGKTTSKPWTHQCRCIMGKKFTREKSLSPCIIHLKTPLPSIIPYSFWTPFWKWCNLFVTMKVYRKWTRFRPFPVFSPYPVWCVYMAVRIVECTDPDFDGGGPITLGVYVGDTPDDQLGLTGSSIGYHSDDGYVYYENLVVGRCPTFQTGDTVFVGIDYCHGVVHFTKKYDKTYSFPLHGEFLYKPIYFGICMDKTGHRVRINVMCSSH